MKLEIVRLSSFLIIGLMVAAILAPTNAHALEKCQRKRLKALREYSRCIFRAGERALDRDLTPYKLYERKIACVHSLEREIARSGRKGKACNYPGDVAGLLKILNNAFITAQQRVAPQTSISYSCQAAPEDQNTERCVITSSALPLDLTDMISQISSFSGVAPEDLAISVEAYGGNGHAGNSVELSHEGGGGGTHGYASTTWTLQAFQEKSTDLYIYVGEHPSSGGHGGSSSLVLFKPLADVDNDSVAADTLLIAGGGGAGGPASSTNNGGYGGDGGIAYAGTNASGGNGYDKNHKGQGGSGGNADGNGAGGSASTECSGATDGYAGIGGYGGIKTNDSDSGRAGWFGTSTPSFADWSYGAGGKGTHGNTNGAGGGGGYGGGGGGCHHQGGGGGGSWAAADVSLTGVSPSICGPYAIPDASGNCDNGPNDGIVVIDIRNDTPAP